MKIEALNFYIDINGDGRYNGWEIWEAVKWVYRLPGNLLIEGVGNVPFLAGLLNIQASEATGYASFNNWMVVGFSLLFWLALLMFLASFKHDTDDAPAQAQAQAQAETPTQLRLSDERKVKSLLENKKAHHRHHHGHPMAGHHFK
ncbi:MAG: hypothetical protein KA735_04425 [Burkholderiaceae bacterium]|nr:hypothetical protein [Burkholderiaceae bacterium]